MKKGIVLAFILLTLCLSSCGTQTKESREAGTTTREESAGEGTGSDQPKSTEPNTEQGTESSDSDEPAFSESKGRKIVFSDDVYGYEKDDTLVLYSRTGTIDGRLDYAADHVVLDDSVTQIDMGVFDGCDIGSIFIPKTVTSIVIDYDFTASLEEFVVHPQNEHYSAQEGILFSRDKATLYKYPEARGEEKYTIPNSVITIGKYAFFNSRLTEVVIPDTVTTIEDCAFRMSEIASIYIPKNVEKIGNCAFENYNIDIQVSPENQCFILENDVLYSADKTELYWHSPKQDASFTSFTIPDGIKRIAGGAFVYNELLEQIVIPGSVTEIGEAAFLYCSSLTEVSISESVISIGKWAFDLCENLAAIHVESGNERYMSEEGVLFNKDRTILYKVPPKKTGDSHFIPESVLEIGEYAFELCDQLTSIAIPGSVVKIGEGAFDGCSSLTSLVIPPGITEIEAWTFSGCSALTSITIPDSVARIGEGAFSYCSSLTSFVFPPGITAIESSTFYDCSALTSVDIPDSVTIIGEEAFSGMWVDKPSGLTTILIPNSVQAIGKGAFWYCNNLVSITLPACVTDIEKVFGKDFLIRNARELSRIQVHPENQLYCSIDGVLFSKDGSILYHYPARRPGQSYTVPEGVKKIDERAFQSENISSVFLPEGLEEIGPYAFWKCNNLVRVSLPESLKVIGEGVFAWCEKLESIQIPKGIQALGDGVFYDCRCLTHIDVDSRSEHFLSEEGVLFSKDKSVLLRYPANKTGEQYTIPRETTALAYNAFGQCTGLVEITIPEGVTSIGQQCFEGADHLSGISIPAGVTSIPAAAFSGCSSLTDVFIPHGIKKIERNAFHNCGRLTFHFNGTYEQLSTVEFDKDWIDGEYDWEWK